MNVIWWLMICLEITLNASPIINVITVAVACPTECICLSPTQVSYVPFFGSTFYNQYNSQKSHICHFAGWRKFS